jgi:hypothetical protein
MKELDVAITLMAISAFHAGYVCCSMNNGLPIDEEKLIDDIYNFVKNNPSVYVTKDMVREYFEKIKSFTNDLLGGK